MKKWMIVDSGENYILLHRNEEFEQYDKFKRVPNWIVWLLKIGEKRNV